jgi:hypothetical protein
VTPQPTNLLTQLLGLVGSTQNLMLAGPKVSAVNPSPAVPCESPNQQKDLENAIDAWKGKNKAFNTALTNYDNSHIPHTFTDMSTGGLSLKTINGRLDELEKLEPDADSSLQVFNRLLRGTQQSSKQAQALVAALNNLVQQKTWTDLTNAIGAENASIQDYQSAQKALLAVPHDHCDQHSDDDRAINASLMLVQNTLEVPNRVVDGLEKLDDRLNEFEHQVNVAYGKSATFWVQLLPLPKSNSLNSVTLAITDAWVPFTIASSGIDPNPFGAITSSTGGGTDQHQFNNNATLITINPPNGSSPGSITITPGANTTANAPQPAPKPAPAKSAAPTPNTASTPAASSPINLTVTSDTPQRPQTQQTGGSDKSATTDPGNVTLLSNGPFLVQPHKVVHFVATGGAFAAHEPTESYAAKQLPTTLLTNINSTVTTTPASGMSSTSTTNNTTVTNGTEYVPYRSDVQRWHPGAIVGITWFPGGLDTYSYSPRRHGQMTTTSFSEQSIKNLGLFLGSTVNTSGTFTFGPAYEITPGIEFLVGGTLLSSDSLSLGVTPCRGVGTILTSNTAPASTVSTDITDPMTGTRTVTKTTTTVTTQTNCNNADATVLVDTTVPTQSNTRVGFTFGILLNSNLFKAFGWVK